MIHHNFPMGMAVSDLIDAFEDHDADELVFHINKKDNLLHLTFVINFPDDENLVQRHHLKIEQFKKTGEPHVAFDHILTQMHNEFVTKIKELEIEKPISDAIILEEENDEDSNGRLDT